MKWTMSAGAFLIGMGAMWGLQQTVFAPGIPDGYYDLSAMPDELEEQFAEASFIETIVKQEEMKAKMLAERAQRISADELLKLPDGVPTSPFGIALRNAPDGSRWPSLNDANVQTILDEAKSDWVILNFWARWCAPCLHELPDMNNAAAPLSDLGVTLIAVNADPLAKDTPEVSTGIFAEKGIDRLLGTHLSGIDIEIALTSAGLPPSRPRSFPHSVIYAPGGVPIAYFEGFPQLDGNPPVWASEDMLGFFEALVANYPV